MTARNDGTGLKNKLFKSLYEIKADELSFWKINKTSLLKNMHYVRIQNTLHPIRGSFYVSVRNIHFTRQLRSILNYVHDNLSKSSQFHNIYTGMLLYTVLSGV